MLTGLREKGYIKAKKLVNAPGTIRWNYILTPKGAKEKARITRDYLDKRLKEFEKLKTEINILKKEVVETPGAE